MSRKPLGIDRRAERTHVHDMEHVELIAGEALVQNALPEGHLVLLGRRQRCHGVVDQLRPNDGETKYLWHEHLRCFMHPRGDLLRKTFKAPASILGHLLRPNVDTTFGSGSLDPYSPQSHQPDVAGGTNWPGVHEY